MAQENHSCEISLVVNILHFLFIDYLTTLTVFHTVYCLKNCEGCGRTRSFPGLKYVLEFCLMRITGAIKHHSEVLTSPDRVLNSAYSYHKTKFYYRTKYSLRSYFISSCRVAALFYDDAGNIIKTVVCVVA